MNSDGCTKCSLYNKAYAHAFDAVFSRVKELHPTFEVGKTLKGIIADWSDVQLQGLRKAIGEEKTSQVVKGCQVRKFTNQTLCLSVFTCTNLFLNMYM